MADTSKLPTLEDFMEDSTGGGLVTTSTPEKKKPEAAPAGTPPPGDDQAKAAEAAKAAADAAAKAEADKTAAAKAKADADKAAAEAEKKKKDQAQQPAKTQDEVNALVKKAEEKPETLTAEERKYLLDNDLFEEEKKNFWEEVEQIHGVKVEVDFQGKDPESAEGAALRDQALMDMAAQQQIAYLQQTYPEAYQILEHVANGGKVQDLVNPEEPDFSKITLEKDDKEGQKELLLNYYLQKGFEEKDARRYVEADEDSSEGLLAVAQKALKQLATTQAEKQKQVFEQQKAAKAQADQRNAAFKQNIKALTDTGKLGDFTILNKKDREEFYQFAVSNIYSDGKNGYQVVLPVNDKTAIPVLQQLFFGFKGGKLDEFVKREAQTQNVTRLKRKVAQAAATAGGHEGENKGTTQKNLPTFDIFKADE